MSDEEQKFKRSKRIADKHRYIAKQMRLVKKFGWEGQRRVGHRLHKVSFSTCGNKNCVMCGNPRKFNNELTMAEKLHRIEEKEFLNNQQEVVDMV